MDPGQSAPLLPGPRQPASSRRLPRHRSLFALESRRHASGRTHEKLTAHRLVRELAADGDALRYHFVHDKLRTTIYDDTRLARWPYFTAG